MSDDTELLQILRLLSGELSPDQARAVRERAAREPALAAQLAAWQQVRDARPSDWNTEDALASLRHQLGHDIPRRPARMVDFPAPRRRPRRWAASVTAAAAVLVVGIGVAAVWQAGRGSRADDHLASGAAYREYAAPVGRRASVQLSDGTQVLLAAATRLRVPRDFGRPAAPRDVHLEGEAYFDVTHDDTRPFLVRTATSLTEDLGTKFTIRAYPNDKTVDVAVTEGVVAVTPALASARGRPPRQVLIAGQLAHLDAEGGLEVVHDADLEARLGWTTGVLHFDRRPFREVAADVERWYDLEIRLADPALESRRASGSVATNEPADVVLGYLALALDVRYTRHGRVVTFFGR